MFLDIVQIAAKDSTALKIPSLTDRLNFTLLLIVVLFIVMFFLLLKSYSINSRSDKSNGKRPYKDGTKAN